MCSVEVAEVESDLCTIEAFAGAKAFDGLVETVAADDPLGAHPYSPLSEGALGRAIGNKELIPLDGRIG